MRKNVFKLVLVLGAVMLLGFSGCTVEVNNSEPVTPKSYAVGISEGIENGSVSADRQTAQKGQTVTLTLTANAGYKFGSVSVKDASNNSVEIATVTAGTKYMFSMPESNVTVSASFTPESNAATGYTVGISEGIENGSVTTDKLTAQKGQTVTLTLTANAGYQFDSISVKDASNNSVETATVTAGTEYTFVMPESNVTVSATFTATSYAVSVSTGIENGSVTTDKLTAQKGQTVTLTLAANAGYKFGSISVKDASNNSVETATVTAGTEYTFVMPESNVTVSATFVPRSYTVGISTGVVNGSVRADKQTAQKGQTVTLTISVNEGYKLSSVSVKDASNSSVDTRAVTAGTKYTFVMPASNVTVSATFVPRSYAVGISTGIVNGSVRADKQTAQKGETITLTLSVSEDYKFVSVSVKDVYNNSVKTRAVTAGTKYTFVMPASNVTVSATFMPKRYVEMVDVITSGTTIKGANNTNDYAGVFIANRNVTLSPFSMGKYEVTQDLYKAVMAGESVNGSSLASEPWYCRETGDYPLVAGETQKYRPVEGVTWYDAVYFCNVRTEKTIGGANKVYTITDITVSSGHITSATVSMDRTKTGYRLPTEAEWEFAARGGDTTKADWNYTFSGHATVSRYYTGSVNEGIDSVGWYEFNTGNGGVTGDSMPSSGTAGYGTHEVGKKTANRLGLCDMTGNVSEWCYDWWYDSIDVGNWTDPTPTWPGSDSFRVIRGGTWDSYAQYCTVCYRSANSPYGRYDHLGFRVVRSRS